MLNTNELTSMHIDVLKEIGNIGSGNAATALAALLQGRITIDVPEVRFTDVNTIAELLGGPENQAAGVLVLMKGDIQGMLLFILEEKDTAHILKCLLNEDLQSLHSISEMGVSALTEISNILSGSYINALAQLLGFSISLDIPRIAVDMVGAILNYPASVFGAMSDDLLLIEECFHSQKGMFKSNLLIMPEPLSLEKMFRKIGVL